MTGNIWSSIPNMDHGYDGIFIHMLKLCSSSTSQPFSLLFKNSFEEKKNAFLTNRKRENIVPIHKQHDKELIEN